MKKGSIKEKFLLWANKHELTREMLNNYGVRTVIFATVSFVISIAYGVYNLTLSVTQISIWYGVLAGYYILLAIMRGGVVFHHRKKRKAQKIGKVIENEKVKQIKKYRICGILLVIMTFALSIAVMEMISEHKTFEHAGLMIYVSATYTFYKVTVAIINIVKAKKQSDMTVQAIRNINMADAIVSILTLQTSMIHSFGADDGVRFADTLNGATGAVVCALVFALGIYMIVNSQRQLRIEIANKDNNALMEEAKAEEGQYDSSQGV
ncbi:MAG: hypothetical protein K2O86_00540 [Clostridia bacterium]|nr:hypothetical protein [Clostridia bacterium]